MFLQQQYQNFAPLPSPFSHPLTQMSSLFDHQRESTLSTFNKLYRIKKKNRQGYKNIVLNVRSFKSPDVRSNSLRKRSPSKLFKDAHKIPSQTTQQNTCAEKSQNDFFCPSTAEIQKIACSTKTRRTNTMEEKKKKITLKKKLSLGNSMQKTVQVCINGENILETNETNLVDSLTKLILEDSPANRGKTAGDLDSLLGQSTINEDSFELQIDSNLMNGNPELLEWSQLIKRI